MLIPNKKNKTMSVKNADGFAVALAFPSTYCKQAGAWYDHLLNRLRIANNNFYKVGHAAVLLIDTNNQKCHYFDFGRYHAPYQYGRVRSEETDHELGIETGAKFSKNFSKITNFNEILTELQSRDVFHGAGDLHASYTKIHFKKSYDKAIQMQEKSPILYGPFCYNGTNCSRYVNTVIRAGNPNFRHWFKLLFFKPLTPTPAQNVNVLSFKTIIPKQFKEKKFYPLRLNRSALKSTLKPPKRNQLIPEKAIWLSGEGAGSWFVLELNNNILKADRYSPAGKLECSGHFKSNKKITFKLSDDCILSHLSHCISIKLIYNNETFQFFRINDRD